MQSPEDDVDTHIAFLRSAIRLLEVPTENANEDHSGEDQTTKVIWFACAAVGVILCYCYCLVSVVKQRWCGRQQAEVPADEGPVVVHDGIIFNLNPAQRRAVLEVIFSEASEAVEEKKPWVKSNKTVDDEEDSIENDVEEGKSSESITMDAARESYHEQEAAASAHSNDGNGIEPAEVMKAMATLLPNSTGGTLEAPLSPVVNADAEHGSSFAQQTSSPLMPSESASCDECIPSLPHGLSIPRLEGQEECKEEDVPAGEESTSPFPLTIAPNLTRQDSILSTNFDFIDDDSTDGNVCAICLSGYEEGEKVIKSRHCVHLFHRDCILEWLGKHNVCPCCRVDMVTESEIRKTATTILGVGAAVTTSNHPSNISPPYSPN